ncbi:Bacterial membrane flanked domain protein [Rubripirellula lacrimiformis]|uniref:Bacterial membrane flanked domain protein n=1 Tax=Rubripirellula lacrimiformis TaxID=1930273 RepID=A0A517NIS6_9BACT|nr:PH domain-containing protein [Rubripirellula lacrimiformis]QDT07039.1 Bacterial membrane flanked domain protein [Rubripirellula lacrimiformis]
MACAEPLVTNDPSSPKASLMQVLSAICPYCNHDVDSTIDHLDGPIVCPECRKPFEMEMPTAVVTSVQEVDEKTASGKRLAADPDERTLIKVHPVVLRARPVATLILGMIFLVAAVAMILSITGMAIAGYSLNDTMSLGPASLLTWVSAITLSVEAVVIGYWVLLSRFTTLTVTDDRTIYQRGIVSRETSEVQHDDVRNIQLDQSFMQRLLNVGSVGISSSGQDDLEVVAERLPGPKKIIQLIRENQQ